MIGKILNDRYEIREVIGLGGTAVVYKGVDRILGRIVTIKILRDEFVPDAELAGRFLKEARSIASFSHPNIVSIYDVGVEGRYNYLVMEYIDGVNLKDFLNAKGALPVNAAVQVTQQILSALQHAHDHGIIHRDIKAHNIIISRDGQVKVTDFGIAAPLTEQTQTYQGDIVGSVQYIAPEQVQGATPDRQTDIYSLGVLFYEMLTGELPYNGSNPIEVAMQHVRGGCRQPCLVNREVPPDLSRIVMKAMSVDKNKRYATALEMAEDLRKFAAGQGIPEDLVLLTETEPTDISVTRDVRRGRRRSTTESSRRTTEERKHEGGKGGGKGSSNGGGGGRRLNWKVVTAILIAVLLIWVVWMVVGVVRSFVDGGEELVVPFVTGYPLEEAQAMLDEVGLTYSVTERADSNVEINHVISQSLSAGTVVKGTHEVGLVVSTGPDYKQMPAVEGMEQRMAEIALSNAGIEYTISTKNSDSVQSGYVIEQTPAAKTDVDPSTTAVIVVSSGPALKEVVMPDLSGMTLSEAESMLENERLKLGSTSEKESYDYIAGRICGQSVDPHSRVMQGSSVNLTISTGPGPVAKQSRVLYNVPNDGADSHVVRIVVEDPTGKTEVFKGTLSPGDEVVQDVEYVNKGTIYIYLDDELVSSQAVS